MQGQPSNNIFRLAAFAVLFKDDEVLLCHRRDYDLWNLPGGAVEPGESPWQAAVRETQEEAGLEIEVQHLVGIYAKPQKNEVAFSFLGSIIGGEITTSDEADQVTYFPVSALPKNLVPKQRERVLDAYQWDGQIVMKTQSGLSSVELYKQGKL